MKNIIIYILAVVLLSSCDYLDYDEKNYLLEDDIYSDFGMSKAALTNIYRYLPSGYTPVGNAMMSSACDDAVFANDASAVHKFTNGSWSAIQTLDAKWGHNYTGIRAANKYLTEVGKYTYDDHRYDVDPSYDVLMKQLSWYKAEARALRAFFYFELAKRYGNVPLVTEVLSQDEASNLERTPFNEVIKFIVEECDSAASYLPTTFDDATVVGEETGRITKGAAMAIKARALLYAASPLHNPTNDVEKWKAAAKAHFDIIDMNVYSIYSIYTKLSTIGNSEMILERRAGESNSFERINFPIGYEGGYSGNCPTQNLVDAYEMKSSGLSIGEDPKFDPNDPYKGRDVRLKMSILYNGLAYKGQDIETFEGGANGAPLRYATPTGYYLRKQVDETVSLEAGSTNTKIHTWVLYRYAEILLNYAEAMNEAYGPEVTGSESTMTALDAVNEVRARRSVRMKAFPAGMTAEAFRTKLRNERRVELAFENHRFWDIRRWKVGNETNEIRGVKIYNEADTLRYEYRVIDNRTFENRMYLFPIPLSETLINTNLGQNQGW